MNEKPQDQKEPTTQAPTPEQPQIAPVMRDGVGWCTRSCGCEQIVRSSVGLVCQFTGNNHFGVICPIHATRVVQDRDRLAAELEEARTEISRYEATLREIDKALEPVYAMGETRLERVQELVAMGDVRGLVPEEERKTPSTLNEHTEQPAQPQAGYDAEAAADAIVQPMVIADSLPEGVARGTSLATAAIIRTHCPDMKAEVDRLTAERRNAMRNVDGLIRDNVRITNEYQAEVKRLKDELKHTIEREARLAKDYNTCGEAITADGISTNGTLLARIGRLQARVAELESEHIASGNLLTVNGIPELSYTGRLLVTVERVATLAARRDHLEARLKKCRPSDEVKRKIRSVFNELDGAYDTIVWLNGIVDATADQPATPQATVDNLAEKLRPSNAVISAVRDTFTAMGSPTRIWFDNLVRSTTPTVDPLTATPQATAAASEPAKRLEWFWDGTRRCTSAANHNRGGWYEIYSISPDVCVAKTATRCLGGSFETVTISDPGTLDECKAACERDAAGTTPHYDITITEAQVTNPDHNDTGESVEAGVIADAAERAMRRSPPIHPMDSRNTFGDKSEATVDPRDDELARLREIIAQLIPVAELHVRLNEDFVRYAVLDEDKDTDVRRFIDKQLTLLGEARAACEAANQQATEQPEPGNYDAAANQPAIAGNDEAGKAVQ